MGTDVERTPQLPDAGTSAVTTPQSADTTIEAERRQLAIWRSLSETERLRLTGELCDSVRYLAEMGLRDRYPHASDAEIRLRLFATWLDRPTMIRCFGWDPVEH